MVLEALFAVSMTICFTVVALEWNLELPPRTTPVTILQIGIPCVE